MKANEVRLGNWYNENGVNRIVSPTTIEEMSIVKRSWIKPIPITEEWLLKFGFFNFEETGYRWFLKCEKNRNIIITFDLDDYCIKISDTWEFGKRKYVHEIQNLYFALTGEELTLKENL